MALDESRREEITVLLVFVQQARNAVPEAIATDRCRRWARRQRRKVCASDCFAEHVSQGLHVINVDCLYCRSPCQACLLLVPAARFSSGCSLVHNEGRR